MAPRRRTLRRRRRVVTRRHGNRRRPMPRMRRFRRHRTKSQKHTYAWKAQSSLVIVGNSTDPVVLFDPITWGSLPVDATTLTPIYSHARILKVRYFAVPVYNVNQLGSPTTLQSASDEVPEIISCIHYGPGVPNTGAGYQSLRCSRLCKFHQWNRPWSRTIYPKVSVMVQSANSPDGTSATHVWNLKKAGWFELGQSADGSWQGNFQFGSLYVASGSSATTSPLPPVGYKISTTYIVQFKKV